MTVNNETLVERVQESYRQLAVVATTLNIASDKLGASVSGLDIALKKLNLGISSWVHFSEDHSADGLRYSYQDIGYTKIGGKWGLAIKTTRGHEASDADDVEQWPFNEAPRALRVRAVSKIPNLLEELIKNATEIVKVVNKQADEVEVLTQAINAIPNPLEQEGW